MGPLLMTRFAGKPGRWIRLLSRPDVPDVVLRRQSREAQTRLTEKRGRVDNIATRSKP